MKRICDTLLKGHGKLAVIGLGYVGLPLARAFGRCMSVIGFDCNREKVEQLQKETAQNKACLEVTADPNRLKEACCFVVAVPTPVLHNHIPDVEPLKNAAHLVGEHLRPGSLVVFESTVYPGVTEEVCLPIIRQVSGLEAGTDWSLGYSPERINPGDLLHPLETIPKIVAGMDAETTEELQQLYDLIIDAGTVPVSSIRTAEAAKVLENTQRDINIAFMNEAAVFCHELGLDTSEVAGAMDTKWNALGFRPGLVGGHCIGVDPYYLIWAARQAGIRCRLTEISRQINENMGLYVAKETLRELKKGGIDARQATVLVLGVTYKENSPDCRNSKVFDLIRELQNAGVRVMAADPLAAPETVQRELGIGLTRLCPGLHVDCVIVAVAHDSFCQLQPCDLTALFKPDSSAESRLMLDVKSIYSAEALRDAGIRVWRL